jgi:hypothetical protein
MIKRKKELSKIEESITKGHLTKNERDLITIFHAQGLSRRQIAKELNEIRFRNKFCVNLNLRD